MFYLLNYQFVVSFIYIFFLYLQAHALAIVVLRLGAPGKEGNNVLGHLTQGCGCAYTEECERQFDEDVKRERERTR